MARKKKPKKVTRPKIEALLERYLQELHLPYKANCHIDKYCVDFLVAGKFIVECYGDFFHCNPKKYEPTHYNKVLRCEAQDKWAKDSNREIYLRQKGHRFLALWESEIAYHEKYCKSKVKQLLARG